MTGPHEKSGRPRSGLSGVLALLSCLCSACGEDGARSAAPEPSFWITEADYQFGDAPERDVLFSDVSLRVDTLRDLSLVLDYFT